MAKAPVQYQALLNDRSAAVIPTSLKVTSGANGFKVMDPFESWKNNKTLISQSEYDGLEEHLKEGKYSSEQIESYFTLNLC